MHTIKEINILKNDNLTINHDAEQKIFLVKWNHNRPMAMQSFKSEMLVFKKYFIDFLPKDIIWLQEGFTTEITPEAHLWVEENVNIDCLKYGLQKCAFVVGKDVMAHLSVYNFFEDVESCLKPKHFAGVQEAIDWVLEQ